MPITPLEPSVTVLVAGKPISFLIDTGPLTLPYLNLQVLPAPPMSPLWVL